MKKIEVEFSAGESRSTTYHGNDGHIHMAGCNFMLATFESADGDEIELYAELSPEDFDEFAGIDGDEWSRCGYDERFDAMTYPMLKEKIIEQAVSYGISEQELDFPY